MSHIICCFGILTLILFFLVEFDFEFQNLDGECALPNLLELVNQFEETGVCLGRDETYRIYLALKKLTEIHPLETCRFWGKIQGTKKNYIVAQASFREGADEEEAEEEAQEAEEENIEGEGEGEDEEDKLPESKWQPPMKIPNEERGTGTNKFTFFVCNKVTQTGQYYNLQSINHNRLNLLSR